TEVWWSKFDPTKSSLTGQTSMEFNNEYEKNANQQGSMGLGFRHSLLEVPIAALERAQKIDDPASIRNSIRDNSFSTIVGPIDFKKGPFPNTAETKCSSGQWRKGTKWPLELVIVDNSLKPEVPVGGAPEAITYK
ncbi:MAG: hypothetical protein ACREFC_13720, partial [Stellaceae bacterium]